MRALKQLVLVAAFIFCISMSASAQNNDGKKTPPKDGQPPVVVVKGKDNREKPKEDKNRGNDNRGKKPQAFLLKTDDETEISSV
ncbi:MAG: hypothetical protein M3033_14155 [Acidobacteriota bacterium]|nr:hypothetical protein [Acidobacteriota bacterium]